MDNDLSEPISTEDWILCASCELYYCKARYSSCPKCTSLTCDHCNTEKAVVRFGGHYAGLKLCGHCALAYIKRIELIPKGD